MKSLLYFYYYDCQQIELYYYYFNAKIYALAPNLYVCKNAERQKQELIGGSVFELSTKQKFYILLLVNEIQNLTQ